MPAWVSPNSCQQCLQGEGWLRGALGFFRQRAEGRGPLIKNAKTASLGAKSCPSLIWPPWCLSKGSWVPLASCWGAPVRLAVTVLGAQGTALGQGLALGWELASGQGLPCLQGGIFPTRGPSPVPPAAVCHDESWHTPTKHTSGLFEVHHCSPPSGRQFGREESKKRKAQNCAKQGYHIHPSPLPGAAAQPCCLGVRGASPGVLCAAGQAAGCRLYKL